MSQALLPLSFPLRKSAPSPAPRVVPPPAGMSDAALRLLENLDAPAARAIRSGRDLVRAREHRPERFETTIREIDRLLDGGLERGRLTEISGARSTGRFAIVLSLLASATSRGEIAALVDTGNQLDPRDAESCGIDPERLLWVRPESTRDGIRCAEMLVTTGFPLVALDLGVRLRGRGTDAVWTRLARATREAGIALVVSTPWPVSGHAAEAALALRRGRGIWKGGGRTPALLDGLGAEIHVEKHRAHRPGALAKRETRSPESLR
jgi:hypothetical protein